MHAVHYLNCFKGVSGLNEGRPYCTNLAALRKPSDLPWVGEPGCRVTPGTMGIHHDVRMTSSLDASGQERQ
jgi:hypothetical protein